MEEKELEVNKKYGEQPDHDSAELYRENQHWAWPIWRMVPYSHKQKKQQNKEKKKRRQDKDAKARSQTNQPSRDDLLLAQLDSLRTHNKKQESIVSIFEKESPEEIEARKKKGFEVMDFSHRDNVWREELESTEVVDMPVRPPYSKGESVEQLEERERGEFHTWMSNIIEKYGARLNYFEMNLEVWRQLWRVMERSDVLLLVVDARFPLFHFPPSLYNFAVNVLKKPMILVLNKTDIVDKRIVDEWEKYFMDKYPTLKIVRFSSFAPALGDDTILNIDTKRKAEKGRKKYENGEGKKSLLAAIQSFGIVKESNEAEGNKQERITIGAIGQPNVGKSSLINGLAEKKVVSTSSTPGHTKHFQTILINLEDESGKNSQFTLCDCPGLVFPAVDISKELQVLSGVYPIAQVREVFSAIRFLAERVPIEQIYSLNPPTNGSPWSPYLLLEAYAIKRGYREAKTGQADCHRAGGDILRDCLDGHIVISWPPPGVNLASLFPASYSSSEGEESAETEESGETEELDESNESNEDHHVNNFRENQRKKRERKLKKKQQMLEL